LLQRVVVLECGHGADAGERHATLGLNLRWRRRVEIEHSELVWNEEGDVSGHTELERLLEGEISGDTAA
jgi:hypothetical protein